MLNQEAKNNDEELKERFRLVCKADPLDVQFAKNCSSAVALLARTVSTFQMANEIFGAICSGQEGMKTEDELAKIATQCMQHFAGMQAPQMILLLSRLAASCAFTEYMHKLKAEQSKH